MYTGLISDNPSLRGIIINTGFQCILELVILPLPPPWEWFPSPISSVELPRLVVNGCTKLFRSLFTDSPFEAFSVLTSTKFFTRSNIDGCFAGWLPPTTPVLKSLLVIRGGVVDLVLDRKSVTLSQSLQLHLHIDSEIRETKIIPIASKNISSYQQINESNKLQHKHFH